jgi:hypothetical protein
MRRRHDADVARCDDVLLLTTSDVTPGLAAVEPGCDALGAMALCGWPVALRSAVVFDDTIILFSLC